VCVFWQFFHDPQMVHVVISILVICHVCQRRERTSHTNY
jgi:hypothetical protein